MGKGSIFDQDNEDDNDYIKDYEPVWDYIDFSDIEPGQTIRMEILPFSQKNLDRQLLFEGRFTIDTVQEGPYLLQSNGQKKYISEERYSKQSLIFSVESHGYKNKGGILKLLRNRETSGKMARRRFTPY